MYSLVMKQKGLVLPAILKVFLGSLFLALTAQIALFFPFSPVPFTLYPVTLLVLAAVLGKKQAALAVIVYIMEGLMGMPVFAGGASGFTIFLKPNGLFVISFILTTYVSGALLHQWAKGSSLKTFVTSLLAIVLLYAIVLPSLSLMIGWGKALSLAFLPFILADFIKVVLAHKLILKLSTKR